jgi:cell division protein FtsA
MGGLPVRRAYPIGVGGLSDVVKSPSYATAVGLVKYGSECLRNGSARLSAPPPRMQVRLGSRIGGWFREVF